MGLVVNAVCEGFYLQILMKFYNQAHMEYVPTESSIFL